MKKSQCDYANEVQIYEKVALRCATCCIVQSDEKWDYIARRVVQKLQNGKNEKIGLQKMCKRHYNTCKRLHKVARNCVKEKGGKYE